MVNGVLDVNFQRSVPETAPSLSLIYLPEEKENGVSERL